MKFFFWDDETLAGVKARIKTKLLVSDEEFSKDVCAHYFRRYLKDADILLNQFTISTQEDLHKHIRKFSFFRYLVNYTRVEEIEVEGSMLFCDFKGKFPEGSCLESLCTSFCSISWMGDQKSCSCGNVCASH